MTNKSDQTKVGLFARFKRIWRVMLRCFMTFSFVYFAFLIVGLIPINNDFVESPEGVEISIVSNGVHGDFILPVENSICNWRDHFPSDFFRADTAEATHVAIGWGDHDFYINTPTWSDLKAWTVFKALCLPSKTCVHVEMTRAEYWSQKRTFRISSEKYRDLVEFVLKSCEQKDNKAALIPNACYHNEDAFLHGTGSYHCFNTCNSWIGRGMQTAGIRTPLFTPLPKMMFLWTK